MAEIEIKYTSPEGTKSPSVVPKELIDDRYVFIYHTIKRFRGVQTFLLYPADKA